MVNSERFVGRETQKTKYRGYFSDHVSFELFESTKHIGDHVAFRNRFLSESIRGKVCPISSQGVLGRVGKDQIRVPDGVKRALSNAVDATAPVFDRLQPKNTRQTKRRPPLYGRKNNLRGDVAVVKTKVAWLGSFVARHVALHGLGRCSFGRIRLRGCGTRFVLHPVNGRCVARFRQTVRCVFCRHRCCFR